MAENVTVSQFGSDWMGQLIRVGNEWLDRR